jgi:hypothetical protein
MKIKYVFLIDFKQVVVVDLKPIAIFAPISLREGFVLNTQ